MQVEGRRQSASWADVQAGQLETSQQLGRAADNPVDGVRTPGWVSVGTMKWLSRGEGEQMRLRSQNRQVV